MKKYPASLVGTLVLGAVGLAALGCGRSSTPGGDTSVDSAIPDDAAAGSEASRGAADGGGDGGMKNGASDAGGGEDSTSSGGCGAAGGACCVASGGLQAVYCNDGLMCCEPGAVCSAQCEATDADASTCGLDDDAGVPRSGTCPPGQFCCNEGHTGALAWGCRDLDASCLATP
jgi:hypothetical protein